MAEVNGILPGFLLFSVIHLQKKACNMLYFACVFRETGACLSPAVRGWLLGPGAQPVCILQGIPTWLWVCWAVWYLSGVRQLLCLCSFINKKLVRPIFLSHKTQKAAELKENELLQWKCFLSGYLLLGLYSAPVCGDYWIRCWDACVAGLCVNTQMNLCVSPVTPSVSRSTALLPVMAR